MEQGKPSSHTDEEDNDRVGDYKAVADGGFDAHAGDCRDHGALPMILFPSSRQALPCLKYIVSMK